MNTRSILTALTGTLLIFPTAGPAAAQEGEESFVYASYYECAGGVREAVQLIREGWAPIAQKHIQAGHISAANILTHDTGNEWSMALVHVGPDMRTLKGALDEAMGEYVQTRGQDLERLGELCPRHLDYVWTTGPGSASGSAVGQERGSAGMSVYYVCEAGREAVADLLVQQMWAPVLNRQVSEGRLTSWNWLSHYVGGEYRRLLSTDGPDHASLLEARDELIAANAENPALAAAFNEVCNGHTDILWNISRL